MSPSPRPSLAIVNSSSFGRAFPAHLERLERFADVTRVEIPNSAPPSVFHQRLGAADGIIASVTPVYSRAVLDGLPRLRLLARHGVGCDNVDLVRCTELGIAVSKVGPEVEREAVAQMTLALLHAAARQVVSGADAVRRGDWSQRARLPLGVDLCGATVGLVGLGAIGSTVARILALGYRARVVACDPALTAAEATERHAELVSFAELVARSDVISIHCPLLPATSRLFDAATLGRVKRGVIIVNTTRGEILDETALVAALEAGTVGGYATDVVEGEPIGADHRLLRTPNVVVTPHLGGYSVHSLRGMGQTMVDDMEAAFVRGGFPGVLANPALVREDSRLARLRTA